MPILTNFGRYWHCLQAAHAVLQLQETGRAVHKVKTVSLNAMCDHYELPSNPFKGISLLIHSLS